MRRIAKGAEPASLTAHRQTPHCDYDNYGRKDELRHALVTEQCGRCCYCMGRIHSGHDGMKIEHWRCQSRHPAEQLIYRNLLGACLGGSRQPAHKQHCDTRKADSDLLWNPADGAHHIETRVRYELDGSIHADDTAFNDQLNDVLNLNLAVLKNNRKAIYSAALEWWRIQRRQCKGPVPRRRIERERDRYASGDAQRAPYGQVAVWLLDQKLAGMTT